MYPFTNNLRRDQTAEKIEIPLIIPSLGKFTRGPITLGEHLRRRRMALGLDPKDVAAKLDVTTSTVWNWEHGWAIGKCNYIKINAYSFCKTILI